MQNCIFLLNLHIIIVIKNVKDCCIFYYFHTFNINQISMCKKLLSLTLLFCICSSLFSQSKWMSKKDKISIPFELTHNLIIVEAEINDVKLNMLLDSGSDNSILFSFPENDSIKLYDSRKIKINGLGTGENIEAMLSSNNKFKIKEYQDDSFKILVITDQEISLVNKLGIPINGIIGASFFEDYLVEINYSKKKIILHKNTELTISNKTKKYAKKQINLVSKKPYIDLVSNINGKEDVSIKLLIDTGLGDGLWLFENDSIKCKQDYIIDFLGRGFGGDVMGKKSRVEKLILNDFSLEDALVSYPDSLSFSQFEVIKGRNGSLGGEILKRFNWFFDYKNKVFYFRKNKFFTLPFNYNMSGIEVQHSGLNWVPEKINTKVFTNYDINKANSFSQFNAEAPAPADFKYKFELKPVFEISSIRKDSPAAIAGLLKGDILVSINGSNTANLTIQKITDLFQSEEGKLIKIEVERNGKRMLFKFELQKIL